MIIEKNWKTRVLDALINKTVHNDSPTSNITMHYAEKDQEEIKVSAECDSNYLTNFLFLPDIVSTWSNSIF